MTERAADLLRRVGVPDADRHDMPASGARFPDGARFRIEIPSVEGPRCLETVLTEASSLGVPVTRVSQGSGIGMLTTDEIRHMVELAASAGVEVSLFARPGAGWDIGAAARAPAGAVYASAVRGQDQLVAVIEEIRRAADLGIRSVLISDIGVLAAFGRLRAAGLLPAEMQAKVSVMLPVTNAATVQVLAELGASTLNVAPDLSVPQIAAIRSVTDLPIDIYLEAPDDVGGFVRYHEAARLVTCAAPIYLKFGLRNAANIYPSGAHLDAAATAMAAERVRRARLAIERLEEAGIELAECSKPGAEGLALPVAGSAV